MNKKNEMNEIAKHWWEVDHNFSWDQKKVVDMKIKLISRNINTQVSLGNPKDINKIFFMHPQYWFLIYGRSYSGNFFIPIDSNY